MDKYLKETDLVNFSNKNLLPEVIVDET